MVTAPAGLVGTGIGGIAVYHCLVAIGLGAVRGGKFGGAVGSTGLI